MVIAWLILWKFKKYVLTTFPKNPRNFTADAPPRAGGQRLGRGHNEEVGHFTTHPFRSYSGLFESFSSCRRINELSKQGTLPSGLKAKLSRMTQMIHQSYFSPYILSPVFKPKKEIMDAKQCLWICRGTIFFTDEVVCSFVCSNTYQHIRLRWRYTDKKMPKQSVGKNNFVIQYGVW